MDLHPTTRIAGATYVMDWQGNMVIGYRDRTTAERYARGLTDGLFTAAEQYDLRRTAAKTYLATRRARPVPNANQLTLL